MRNHHARCGAGEKPEVVTPEAYLSLLGQIPEFDQKLATIRKYEISCDIILQAISQLKDIYKEKWNTIAANCDSKLFLGCDDSDTIEWLIKMLGKKTTTVTNMSFQGNGNGSTSYNKSSLEVLTIDQITMMQDDECIVRVRGVRPYYGKKYELTNHPNYAAAIKTKGTFEIPISEEEMEQRDRNRGPLKNRKTALFKNMESNTINSASDKQKTINSKKKTREDMDIANKKREERAKKDAVAAHQAIANTNNATIVPVLTPELASSLTAEFSISNTSTEKEIKESAETMIELMHPSIDVIKYGMTE